MDLWKGVPMVAAIGENNMDEPILTNENKDSYIQKILNREGKLISLPKKKILRQAAFYWLIHFFSHGKIYTEKEVNAILNEHCLIGDASLLRREMFNNYVLSRSYDGSSYWRSDFMYDSFTDATLSFVSLDGGILEPLPPNGSPYFFHIQNVLKEGKYPIGQVSFYEGYQNPDTLWLVSFSIEDASKRQGFGRRMFRIIAQSASFCDFKRILTKVPQTNLAAQAFLQTQGFLPTGVIEVDEANQSNTLVMEKILI